MAWYRIIIEDAKEQKVKAKLKAKKYFIPFTGVLKFELVMGAQLGLVQTLYYVGLMLTNSKGHTG